MLTAGVVGAGVFGGFHARKYAELDGVTFVGVYDPHPERARVLAEAQGGRPFDRLDDLLQAVEVVSVATPADTHVAVARRALEFGRHVYVEKPLSADVESGKALLAQAASQGLTVAVGHQERASFAAMGLFDTPRRPALVESVRRGLPNARNRDVSCVLDLMIHDIDLALVLAGEGVVDVHARGGFDAVNAEVVFASGLKAAFTASRQADRRERVMRLSYDEGEVTVDFLAPAFVNTTPFALNPDFAAAGRDPLGVSLAAFLAAVRGERDGPLVDGDEALAALGLAQRIEAAAISNDWL